ncbi:geranylgeranyl reductase family protein [Flexistipes sp.]|uniref:geranylgeranyl reductase family protein n=1 Tax=Flexistipes sp. TaxID=3088135 RepID=UPI002E1E8FC6|nr:geranylgeranyl reductase family protein [Flexistipes sp.]
MNKRWDVIIIGAGPAGSISACKLSEAGLSVLIFDKKDFPREKVCGDGLLNDSIKCLKRCGVYDDVEKNANYIDETFFYSSFGTKVVIPGEYFTIKREIFDNILLKHATGKGVKFLPKKINGVEEGNDCFVCHSAEGESFSSNFGIIATGTDINLLKPSVSDKINCKPEAVGVRKYIQSDYITDKMFVSYERSIIPGYAWIFPLGSGLYNTGCCAFYGKKGVNNLKKVHDEFLKGFTEAGKIVAAKTGETKLKGAVLRCGLKTGHLLNNKSSRYICIGETIGTTYPFTGEGIGKAMESGEFAAEYILERIRSDLPLVPSEYYKLLYNRVFYKHFGYKTAQKWLSNKFLNDLLAKRATKSNFLYEAAKGIINETIDPRQIFSIKGVLKSFLK